MHRPYFLFIFLLLSFSVRTFAQQPVQIRDAQSRSPVPFAAIRLGSSGQGLIADLDGRAIIPKDVPDGFLAITALGYEGVKITGTPPAVILLKAKKALLNEAVVKPDEDKISRILHHAVSARDEHNPDHNDWYRCHVYYKMVADALPADSEFAGDTSKDATEMRAFFDAQHLLMSETYSIRSFEHPQKLQEEVVGSRLSGFSTPIFTGLVTDMLPFGAANDFLKLNGRDFRNPVSRGSRSVYRFNIHDELLQGTDTVWILSFFPKKGFDALRGQVYISSDGWAITHLTGTYRDTVLGSSIRVEQQYAKTAGRWFPQQLNYVYGISQGKGNERILITLQGTSRIDSVSFGKDRRFRFDKVHTLKMAPGAEHLPDATWAALRPEGLDHREARTYVFMDSLMAAAHAEQILGYLAHLPEGKITIGPVDVDMTRLYRHNAFEGSRYGLGLQTGDRVSKHLSLGGWAGYGMRDVHWKWGLFTEAYLDRYRESRIRIGIERDLRDPGRIYLNPEIDNNYLRNYLITRADAYDAYYLSIRRRFGYLDATLTGRHESVVPQYAYTWNYEGQSVASYSSDELSLGLRYAFAERSAPLFGSYYSTGSRYPVVYAKVITGVLHMGQKDERFTQAVGAVRWTTHIPGIGQDRWQIGGGKSWSDAPLPLGKLFAGQGLRDADMRVCIFGGLQTAYPYQFYTDAFVSWSWRHDFDRRFFMAKLSSSFSSKPGLSLAYNGMWGVMEHPEVQLGQSFSIPSNGYHEGGIILRDLLRLQYLNLYYIGLGGGYFHRIDAPGDGVLAFSVDVSL